MQQRIIRIPELSEKKENYPETSLSFKPFLDYIQKRLEDKDTLKKDIYTLILKKFEAYPETNGTIALEDTARYKELLDLLYMVLSTVVEDEKKVLWGLSVPVSPLLFYGSDALYELLFEAGSQQLQSQFLEDSSNMEEQKKAMLYTFLLQKFYNYQFGESTDMTCPVTDPATGLLKHYRINVDTRFVEVTATGDLPDLNLETLHLHLHEPAGMELLARLLPLTQFHFSGFSILTITDITQQQSLAQIRNLLVNSHGKADEASFKTIIQSLQAIAGSVDLTFNLLPLLRVNGHFVDDIDATCSSVLFSLGRQAGVREKFYQPQLEKFVTNSRMVYFRDLDTPGPVHTDIARLLQIAGIRSYALLPVYYANQLVGTFEIYSHRKGLLNENTFARIDPVMPMLAQLMQNTIDNFEAELNETIRKKFTSLQPAVQWKFNEVTWEYLYQSRISNQSYNIKKIEFPQVFPLYGAVDMRNSTLERNKAVLSDLQYQLNLLQEVFTYLRQASGFGLTDEFIYKCTRWQRQIKDVLTTHDEIRINQFLVEEAHPFLVHFRQTHSETTTNINEYFDAIHPATGKAWQHRRQLEESMQYINSAINNYLDLMNTEIQQAYPFYFEKFRTDGIEYDIYIGQSIAPERPFDNVYLKNLRRWQLGSMAAIARLSHALQPQLRVPLNTTQLIFAYSNPIDISFRNEERRFDVEGGYNIRYQILKKRIDKVHIKDSGERLTQPGKIAIIYFDQKDADEYISYMNHLQEKKLLLTDLEYLELEEVQGVSGLKALRIGVQLEGEVL